MTHILRKFYFSFFKFYFRAANIYLKLRMFIMADPFLAIDFVPEISSKTKMEMLDCNFC